MPELPTTPIAPGAYVDGFWISDERRKRRRRAPNGVCAACWRHRRSDTQAGVMYISASWERPQCLCHSCAAFLSRIFSEPLRRWPVALVRDEETGERAESPRGVRQWTLPGPNGERIVFAITSQWRLAELPSAIDPANEQAYDATVARLNALLDELDPVPMFPPLALVR